MALRFVYAPHRKKTVFSLQRSGFFFVVFFASLFFTHFANLLFYIFIFELKFAIVSQFGDSQSLVNIPSLTNASTLKTQL